MNLSALEPREELLQISGGDFFQRQVQLGTNLRQIPQHIAKLIFQSLAILVADHTGAVAKNLLDLPGHLAGLVGQPKRRVDDRMIHRDNAPGLARLALVGVEVVDLHRVNSFYQSAIWKSDANGLTKRTPSITESVLKSSLKTMAI